MSNNKDERDIDEILASIDAMLAEDKKSSSTTDTRKEVVDQAARDSEDKLAVSSSADMSETPTSPLQTFEPFDATAAVENNSLEDVDAEESDTSDTTSPRQRIVLTEANLEPAAQESLPLWAAQSEAHQDEPQADSSQENTPEKADNIEGTMGFTNEVESSSLTDEMPEDAPESLADELGDLSELDDINLPELTSPDDGTPEHEADDVVATAIETDSDLDTESSEVHREEEEPAPIEDNDNKQAAQNPESENDSDNKNDEFDAVFDAIANDDTITFDISEAMDENTLYDIEVLDSELVEAFVQDVAHEEALAFSDSSTDNPSEAHDTNNNDDVSRPSTDIDNEQNDGAIDETNPEQETSEETTVDETQDKSIAASLENNIEEKDDVLEESSPESDLPDSTDIEETPHEEQSDALHEKDIEDVSEQTLDENHAESEAVTEHIMAAATPENLTQDVEQAIDAEDTIILNPDELDPLIEAVCDDVRLKINHHLQQILPELISDALLEHIANQRDHSED